MPPEVTLSLTMPETQYLIAALTKRPYEEVAQLIEKISQQARKQLESEPAIVE
jgi:hypothetical protein